MSDKKSNYWNGVVSRLASLGKSAMDLAAPVVVTMGVNALVDKACEKIEARLKQLYIKTARNSAISFLINLAGILCLAFRPFGQLPSLICSLICFVSASVFTIIRLILWMKEYGPQTLNLVKNIVRMKSIHKGIEQYVLTSFPLISLAYAGIEVGEGYIPALKQIPRIPELVDTFARIFWKRVIVFVSLVCVYTVSVFWILKPILIRRYL